jgi:hypothetical protein
MRARYTPYKKNVDPKVWPSEVRIADNKSIHYSIHHIIIIQEHVAISQSQGIQSL